MRFSSGHVLAAAILIGALGVPPPAARAALEPPSPARPTSIVDFARAQIAASRARDARERRSGLREARAAYVPRAAMSAQIGTWLRAKNVFLLYVSADLTFGTPGFVNVYAGFARGPHPPLLGAIAGLDAPTSLAFDRFANLYVCQTDVGAPVLVFPFGSRSPSRELASQGRTPVSVTVAPDGTAYVSTAQTPPFPAEILVYPPGSTTPQRRIEEGGDAVVSLRTDLEGNLYFTDVFVGFGSFTGEIERGTEREIGAFALPQGFDLDAAGDLVATDPLASPPDIAVYSRRSGELRRVLHLPELFEGFGNDRDVFYTLTADRLLQKRAYPGGDLLDSIRSLRAYPTANFFGIATFPRPPYPLAD